MSIFGIALTKNVTDLFTSIVSLYTYFGYLLAHRTLLRYMLENLIFVRLYTCLTVELSNVRIIVSTGVAADGAD